MLGGDLRKTSYTDPTRTALPGGLGHSSLANAEITGLGLASGVMSQPPFPPALHPPLAVPFPVPEGAPQGPALIPGAFGLWASAVCCRTLASEMFRTWEDSLLAGC